MLCKREQLNCVWRVLPVLPFAQSHLGNPGLFGDLIVALISLEAFKWLGIKFDEGVSFGGEHGPYRQSERRDIYSKR